MLRMLILCLTLYTWRADNSPYQKIKLDERYNTIVSKNTDPRTVLHYKINPDKGLILDCAGFDFSSIRKLNDGKDPDRVHLLFGRSGLFDVRLNTKGETIIDASTVIPMKANEDFAGFEHSDTVIMAIGTVKIVEGTAQLMSFWLGQIEVQ